MKPSEAIANIEYARKWLGSESDFSDEALDMAISALEKQEQDRWHSVAKEGNPKESGAYNCTCSDGTPVRRVTAIRYIKGTNEWAMTGKRTFWKVTAWRPLPEPYTEKKS